MRRIRQVREHRDAILKGKKMNPERRQRLLKRREADLKQRRAKILAARPQKIEHPLVDSPAAKESRFPEFKNYDEYKPSNEKKIIVCHVIESLGMGGAQTMMMELVNGLNKYFGDFCKNFIVIMARKKQYDSRFPKSYGLLSIDVVDRGNMKRYCELKKVDIVVHHRISVSRCVRDRLPRNVKYILINHTFHKLDQVTAFDRCDYYISVCNYLHKRTKWPTYIHPTRRLTILNGVETEYLKDLAPEKLGGVFKTGRCHRLVNSKFKIDSLRWMEKKLRRDIPGHQHYIIGFSSHVKTFCRRAKSCHYFGAISDRKRKMSIIKALDVYFYETFQHEGASVAILESLACGVPVLCKSYGGCPELVLNGVNGFIMRDRGAFHIRLKDLSTNRNLLNKMKEATKQDFDKRLHVRHAACKYMQLFESLI